MATYHKNDPRTIQEMFGSIAATYDKTNAILSFNLHKSWNKALVKSALRSRIQGPHLDLCCGTGEITFTLLNHCERAQQHVYLLDFCQEMLDIAKMKAERLEFPHKLTYIQADAQEIPLANESVACVTIAYGIRNIKDPAKCIKEVYRVLKPGGTLNILELTRPVNPILRAGHQIYLRTFLPTLGWLFTSNQAAYKYLCSSIHTFVDPASLEHIFITSGFQDNHVKRLTGGIATILFAKKPL